LLIQHKQQKKSTKILQFSGNFSCQFKKNREELPKKREESLAKMGISNALFNASLERK